MQNQKHLVIGLGNLGEDLFRELTKRGHIVSTYECPDIWSNVSNGRLNDFINSDSYDFVWYCVGGGSVEAAEENYDRMRNIHVLTPAAICGMVRPETKLVFFSSDYVFGPDTNYAKLKREMELYCQGKKNIYVFRLTSLYGFHQPEKSLFYKILRNYFERGEVNAVTNIVSPTSTEWVAKHLVQFDFDEYSEPINLWRGIGLSVDAWVGLILGIEVDCANRDDKRPSDFNHGEFPMEADDFCEVMADMMKMWRVYVAQKVS